MHLNGTYKNSWNRKQNNVSVTLDSELYRRKPVLTYAISGNVVGSVGEFGEFGDGREGRQRFSILYYVRWQHKNTAVQNEIYTKVQKKN